MVINFDHITRSLCLDRTTRLLGMATNTVASWPQPHSFVVNPLSLKSVIHSCQPRTIKDWNALRVEAMEATTLDTLVSRASMTPSKVKKICLCLSVCLSVSLSRLLLLDRHYTKSPICKMNVPLRFFSRSS